MNYILLLYLLSISTGALDITSNIKAKKTSASTTNANNHLTFRTIDYKRYNESYHFVHQAVDSIHNSYALHPFYQKLLDLKAGHTRRVNIVQIGDSHIQPDLISREVRSGLQDFFGDAGRGLVFPYQVARTNGPLDITSSATSRWSHSKISQLRASSAIGLAGFSLSKQGSGNLQLSLKTDVNSKQQSFDCIRLFVGKGSWHISTAGNTYTIDQESTDTAAREVLLDQPVNGFSLKSLAATPNFFGASLEKRNASGVLFHTIGVNGARYEQYNNEPLFWEQLPSLNADLYILSMGTNEAFYNDMNEELYIHHVSNMVAKLQTVSPHAAILITTTAESFKNGRTNPMIERLNLALKFYCNKMGIPVWDLFEVTGGSGSSLAWLKNNLLQADKIHYQQKAYSMQGALLFDAIAQGYNQFVGTQQPLITPAAFETRTASK